MARPLRIEFPGAAYHVMARGNQGQEICADDGDRQMWLATLGEACRRTGWRVHAWVLLGNHYHLLLETPEGNLGSAVAAGDDADDQSDRGAAALGHLEKCDHPAAATQTKGFG